MENPSSSEKTVLMVPARYAQSMEVLLRAAQDLASVRQLSDIQHVVRRASRELLGADGATFILREKDVCFYAEEDAIAPLWKGKRLPVDSCISGWAMLNRQPAIVPDVFKDPRCQAETYQATFVRSLVIVPVGTGEAVGAIGNYWGRERQPNRDDVRLLKALADSTAIAMENVALFGMLERRLIERTEELERANREIKQLSVTDELTGLNNRRGFYMLAEQQLKGVKRSRGTCALIFIDVDGLKQINDVQGHKVGDAMITDVASVLKHTFRKSDIVARMGGDEFCVLAVNPGDGALAIRERLASEVAGFNRRYKRPYELSMSVGVVEATIDKSLSVDRMLSEADIRMYNEKRQRRAAGAKLTPVR